MENEHQTLENGFFQRSDKIWEDGQGNFAAVMQTMSGHTDEYKFFNYRPQMTSDEPTQVRWSLDHDAIVLPHANIVALIRRGFARFAKPEEMEVVEIHNEAEQIVEPETEDEVTADLKTDTQPDPAANGRAAVATRGEATKARGNATKPRGGKQPKSATRKKPNSKS